MKNFLLSFLTVLLVAVLLSGCAEVREERPVTGYRKPPAGEKLPAWRTEAGQLERMGDYEGALRVVGDAYRLEPDPVTGDRFSLLLSYLDDTRLEESWQRENNSDLKCRIAAEYFSRLRSRPDLEPALKARLTELARQLSVCEFSEDIRTQAQEFLLQAQAGERPEIVIGCLLPLSGANAAAGRRLLKGMELALEVFPENVGEKETDGVDVTAGGAASETGLDGAPTAPEVAASDRKAAPRIRLLVYDTAGEGEKARAGVDYLVREKKVSLIIGPYTGKAANYAAVEAQTLGVTMISLSPLLHDPERYDRVFLHYPTIRNQADDLARLAMLRVGLQRFALLVPRNRYGREFAVSFAKRVSAWGGRIVRRVDYDAALPDYGPAIRTLIGPERYRAYKIKRREYEGWLKEKQRREREAVAGEDTPKKSDRLLELAREIGIEGDELKLDQEEIRPRPLLRLDFDAIVIPDRARTLKLLIPQLAFYDLDECFLLGGRYWNSTELLEAAGEYADGALFVDAYGPGVNPAYDDFLARFKSLWPESEPKLLEFLGYDTIQLVSRLAVGDDGSLLDADAWRKILNECRNLPLASGLTSARPSGELVKQLYCLTYKKKRIEKIEALCR